MPLELLAALAGFSFAASGTPGPNNAPVAASNANSGLRRTMPDGLDPMCQGSGWGFPVMALIVGLAPGEVFAASAALRDGSRWGGAAPMLWGAWRIARSGGLGKGAAPRPFTCVEAAAFQRVNPKGRVMALAVAAQFVRPDRPVATALIVARVFAAAGLSSALARAGPGQALRRVLAAPRRRQLFDAAMGGLIALGVVAMLLDGG